MEVLNKVAEIYGSTPEEIAEVTTENSRQIFGI
jgi:TatD DNase family protein